MTAETFHTKMRHTNYTMLCLKNQINIRRHFKMQNLKVIETNGSYVVSSLEVAEMIGKKHLHLLRDIRGYIDTLGQSKFGYSDFFIQSTYLNS